MRSLGSSSFIAKKRLDKNRFSIGRILLLKPFSTWENQGKVQEKIFFPSEKNNFLFQLTMAVVTPFSMNKTAIDAVLPLEYPSPVRYGPASCKSGVLASPRGLAIAAPSKWCKTSLQRSWLRPQLDERQTPPIANGRVASSSRGGSNTAQRWRQTLDRTKMPPTGGNDQLPIQAHVFRMAASGASGRMMPGTDRTLLQQHREGGIVARK